MKKFIVLLFATIFGSMQVFASAIEVQPTMQTKTNAQDRVWVGTFQLVWNDLIDKIVFNPVRFREGSQQAVKDLNMRNFDEDCLSENSYYKIATKVKRNTKKQIEKAIKKKFKESSDLISKLDLTPRNDLVLIYAMLKKEFEFVNEFDKLGTSLFGMDQTAEYFGINHKSKPVMRNDVTVLFYNSQYDFAIKLATKDNEEVFLYRNSSNKSFDQLYADMLKKENSYVGNIALQINDELKIPNIKFAEEKSFEEFVGKRIMGTNLMIDQAMETVRFKMDNKGGSLKSEAAATIMTMSLLPEDKPRYFNFDNTFVMFIKEKRKAKPYFALRVNDISKFQG